MNNEESSESGGWREGDLEDGHPESEREALQDMDTTEERREGNLLVFTHQLGHSRDKKRMEGDASWMREDEVYKPKSVPAEETD